MRKAIIFPAAFGPDTTWAKIGMASKEAISDFGKPVYATANGVVVLARDMRMGWGNLVIIRHIFLEERQMKTADSVYAHLDKILVREGKQIVRGQQIGTIGTNRGMYIAHLHFEIRKNLSIGYNQRAFAKDLIPTTMSPVHSSPSTANLRSRPQRARGCQYIQLSTEEERLRWTEPQRGPRQTGSERVSVSRVFFLGACQEEGTIPCESIW